MLAQRQFGICSDGVGNLPRFIDENSISPALGTNKTLDSTGQEFSICSDAIERRSETDLLPAARSAAEMFWRPRFTTTRIQHMPGANRNKTHLLPDGKSEYDAEAGNNQFEPNSAYAESHRLGILEILPAHLVRARLNFNHATVSKFSICRVRIERTLTRRR